MARIPVDPLPQVIAQPSPQPRLPVEAFGQQISSAVGQIADTTQQAVRAFGDVQFQKQDEAARSRATLATIQHETGVAAAAAEVSNQLETGQIKYDQAPTVFGDRVKQLSDATLTGIDPRYQDVVQAKLAGVNGRYGLSVSDAAEKARRGELGANFISSLDELGKQAGAQGADIAAINTQAEQLAALGQQAGIAPERVTKAIQDLKDRNYYNQAQNRLITGRTDPTALKQLEHDLTAADGFYADKLDTEKRNALLNTVTGTQLALAQKAELAAARAQRLTEARNNTAQRAFETLQALADKGGQLDPQYVQQVSDATAGTPYAGAVVQLFKQQQETGGFAAQPLQAQTAAIAQIDAEIAKNGRNPALDKRREQLDRVRSQSMTDAQNDPLSAALERGVITDIPPLDFSSPDAITKSLTARGTAVATAAAWAGQPVSPLRPQEAEVLKSALERADTPAKIATFGLLQKNLDRPTYFATIRQLAKDQPQVAALGAIANDNPQAAAAGFEGLRLIKDKTLILPKDKSGGDALVPAFNDLIGTGQGPGPFLDSQQRETAYDVTKAIYAKLSNDAGDASGSLNTRRLKQALDLATGGVAEHGGSMVIKPAGISDDEFALRTQQALQAVAKQSGVPYSHLADLPLVPSPRAEGVYYLANGRDFYRRPGSNEPVTINLTAPAQPFALPATLPDLSPTQIRQPASLR